MRSWPGASKQIGVPNSYFIALGCHEKLFWDFTVNIFQLSSTTNKTFVSFIIRTLMYMCGLSVIDSKRSPYKCIKTNKICTSPWNVSSTFCDSCKGRLPIQQNQQDTNSKCQKLVSCCDIDAKSVIRSCWAGTSVSLRWQFVDLLGQLKSILLFRPTHCCNWSTRNPYTQLFFLWKTCVFDRDFPVTRGWDVSPSFVLPCDVVLQRGQCFFLSQQFCIVSRKILQILRVFSSSYPK